MLDRRRLLVLVAVLFGLTALGATLTAPREPAPPPPAAARPGGPPSPLTAPERGIRSLRLSLDEPRTLSGRVGETLRLEVSGDAVDSVLIEKLDRLEGIDPQSPARIELLPDRSGSYDIRLLDAGRSIGTLEIRP